MNFALKITIIYFFSFLKQQLYHRTNDVKLIEIYSWK